MMRSVFVTVGTDHHPFDRLVGWIDRWYGARTASDVECTVQTGASFAPENAPSTAYMDQQEIAQHLDAADAVVCHGGPSTIMEVRAVGIVPIVVARDPDLGEHVDDHQLRFARHLAAHGAITVANSEPELISLLDRALAEPEAFRVRDAPGTAASVGLAEFTRLLDDLMAAPKARLWSRFLPTRRRWPAT